MKFVIVTHAPHIIKEGVFYAYGPYVKEMNLWAKYVDEIMIVAPFVDKAPSKIDLPYEHNNIKISKIPAISLTSFSESFRTFFLLPVIKWKIFNAMRKADHIHLRCPGNIGLLGCFMQIVFPKKRKTAKYAGNWDPRAKQPMSYKLQKWLLSNTFLTKNMQVLVYGEWPNQTKNIKSFFTATFSDSKKELAIKKSFGSTYKFIFVGTLSEGKRPLYAVKLLEGLKERGVDCTLDIYGEGLERVRLESYINNSSFARDVILHGNQTSETIETAYLHSDFLLLPSKSEGWPKVVAEAMFFGVIPIVPKISCVPWMLDFGGRGLLIDVDLKKDPQQIMNMLEDGSRLRIMSENAQLWSQNYTLDYLETEISKLIGQ